MTCIRCHRPLIEDFDGFPGRRRFRDIESGDLGCKDDKGDDDLHQITSP